MRRLGRGASAEGRSASVEEQLLVFAADVPFRCFDCPDSHDSFEARIATCNQ